MKRKPWPHPADTQLDRARRIAVSYRAALVDHAPHIAEQLDAWAVEHGQGWVTPQVVDCADDDLLTFGEVCYLLQVAQRTIYQWHQRGLPYTETVDGTRIRWGDLKRWEQLRRQNRKRRS